LTDKEYILKLESIIDSQNQQIKMLEEKVLFLMEQIQKLSIKKDSHNSSLPPSTDVFKNKTKTLRVKSKLKSGGQPGHKGSTLEMSSSPDKIIELKSNFCNSCGSDLSKENFVLQAKRQVIELPPITPIYEEYRQFACKCSHSWFR